MIHHLLIDKLPNNLNRYYGKTDHYKSIEGKYANKAESYGMLISNQTIYELHMDKGIFKVKAALCVNIRAHYQIEWGQ